ncbi:MAG TPA: GrpB family protein [Cellulomonas sp.]
MVIEAVEYSERWPLQFASVAEALWRALDGVPVRAIEHVGSTAVPGLAAKPILDIDVIVPAQHVPAAVAALEATGYTHRGDLGVAGREVLRAPDTAPARHVYVCAEGALHVRNHLAVRRVLRERADLRDRYAAVKLRLSSDRAMDIDRYVAGKSTILQEVLALTDLTDSERAEILELNTAR